MINICQKKSPGLTRGLQIINLTYEFKVYMVKITQSNKTNRPNGSIETTNYLITLFWKQISN